MFAQKLEWKTVLSENLAVYARNIDNLLLPFITMDET